MAGDKQAVQIRTRKFIRNNLLARKQFVSFRYKWKMDKENVWDGQSCGRCTSSSSNRLVPFRWEHLTCADFSTVATKMCTVVRVGMSDGCDSGPNLFIVRLVHSTFLHAVIFSCSISTSCCFPCF